MAADRSRSRAARRERIQVDASAVCRGLETLRDDHRSCLKSLEALVHEGKSDVSPVERQKIEMLNDSIRQIESGLDEAKVFFALSRHLNEVEAEKHKLRSQVKRLCQENAWLRDELDAAHRKSGEHELRLVELEERLNQVNFMLQVKSADETDAAITEKDQSNDEQRAESDDIGGTEGDDDDGDGDEAGEAVPEKLRTLHGLVIQYAAKGRYEVAVPLCKQALEDLERTSGHNHPDVATMLNILALVYRDQKKFLEAASLLQDALQIRESTLGENHPAVAATLNNLAVLYGKRGKYREAEPLCKRALEIRERVLGPVHLDVAKQLNNLALLCQNQGKFGEVETYYRRALDIYSRKLGQDDPSVTKTMNNLASSFLKQGKYKQAELLYKEVLVHAHQKEFGAKNDVSSIPLHGSSSKAARLLGETQRHIDSLESRKQASHPYNDYGGWHRAAQVEGPDVATTLKNLSALYRRQGKSEAAETLESCALRSKKKALEAVKQTKVAELLGIEATNMKTETSSLPDQEESKKPKRRSSFFKFKRKLGRRLSLGGSSSMEDLSGTKSAGESPRGSPLIQSTRKSSTSSSKGSQYGKGTNYI
ncbi:kinesin light chain-like [Oscarella lobularis]|uniref:kinesin light chain-like n=1 Tax=Oscarella lobularis TaxID=121494 RepID=UPI00331409EE